MADYGRDITDPFEGARYPRTREEAVRRASDPVGESFGKPKGAWGGRRPLVDVRPKNYAWHVPPEDFDAIRQLSNRLGQHAENDPAFMGNVMKTPGGLIFGSATQGMRPIVDNYRLPIEERNKLAHPYNLSRQEFIEQQPTPEGQFGGLTRKQNEMDLLEYDAGGPDRLRQLHSAAKTVQFEQNRLAQNRDLLTATEKRGAPENFRPRETAQALRGLYPHNVIMRDYDLDDNGKLSNRELWLAHNEKFRVAPPKMSAEETEWKKALDAQESIGGLQSYPEDLPPELSEEYDRRKQWPGRPGESGGQIPETEYKLKSDYVPPRANSLPPPFKRRGAKKKPRYYYEDAFNRYMQNINPVV